MIKNLKQAKELVEKYEEILHDPFELEDLEKKGDWQYDNFGERLSYLTNFNSSGCILCKPLKDDLQIGATNCKACIWYLSNAFDEDFAPKKEWKREYRETYCVNNNFIKVEFAKTWNDFSKALQKRINKLKEFIEKVEKDELQSE